MSEYQRHWDELLVRSWYANKYLTMGELRSMFRARWGVEPFTVGLLRTGGRSHVMLWAFMEKVLPKLTARMAKSPRDEMYTFVERLASCTVSGDRAFVSASGATQKERREVYKDTLQIDAALRNLDNLSRSTRGNQWKVCK